MALIKLVDPLLGLSESTGASNIGIINGGSVQDALGYVTLEMLGYLQGVSSSASDALDAFIALGQSGECATLVLESNHNYPLSRNHVLNFPHTITGRGANFSQGSQIGTSRFVDARGAGAVGYLLSVSDGPTVRTYGWTWAGFEVLGTKSNMNNAVYIDAEGWAFSMHRVCIKDFGKTGLALNAVLDGDVNDLFIANCGGYVDGVVYYGLDMYPTTATYVNNLIAFRRLHMEYCRYMIHLGAFDVTFVDCHLEIGFLTNIPYEATPAINVRSLLRPVTFTNCFFTAAGWELLVSGVPNPTDPASTINGIPYFIGTTYTSTQVLGGGEYDSKLAIRNCNFANHLGYALYIGLPFVPVDMSNCHIMNAGFPNARVPLIVGPRSILSTNKIFTKVIVSDTSNYASVVNNKSSVAVQVASGFATLALNDIYLFNASPTSLAAAVIGNVSASTIVGNHLVGFTQEVSGAVAGSQVRAGLRVTGSAQVLDVLPTGFSSNGGSMEWRLPSMYTNTHPVYSGNSSSFNFSPSNDTGNAYLGTVTARWSEIRAKTATINTSDGRLKEDIRALSEAEVLAAKALRKHITAFSFNADACMPDGDVGKVHFGVVAQDVVRILEEHGLDPAKYAMVVHDCWGDAEATYRDDGSEMTPAVVAGDRYGIMYTELLAFIIAAM